MLYKNSHLENISQIFIISKKGQINTHIESLKKNLALHSSRYDNCIVLGDFKVSIDDSQFVRFL